MMKARSGENWYISAEINKTGPAIEILTDQLWKVTLVNIQMVPPPQNHEDPAHHGGLSLWSLLATRLH